MKPRAFLPFAIPFLLPLTAPAANILWSSAAGSAWLTGTNWTGGTVPGSADAAQFGANPTSGVTGVGINFGSPGAIQQVGAIEITSARSSLNLLVGNSSGTAANTGVLRLNGATVNSVANTVLRNAGAGTTTLTLQNTQGSCTSTMAVVFNNSAPVVDAGGRWHGQKSPCSPIRERI